MTWGLLPFLNIGKPILQTVLAVFETAQTGIAAVADEVPDIASVMIMISHNLCRYARDRSLFADRALKRRTFFGPVLFGLSGLPGFRRSLVNVGSARACCADLGQNLARATGSGRYCIGNSD